MKKQMKFILLIAFVLLQFFHTGCKKTDTGSTDTFTLTVILSEGVTGTPPAGTSTHNSGEAVTYSFTPADGYKEVRVLLDNNNASSTGTITMSANRTLQASAIKNEQFGLTVSLAAGVNGAPAAGYYVYQQGEVVNYSYSLAEGYKDLSVLVEGAKSDNSGTVTMTKSQSLYVTAVKVNDVAGSWTCQEVYNDGSAFQVTLTFTGTVEAGKVADSDGGEGTYTVDNDNITFNLVFPDVTYEYTGSFSDSSNLSGTSKRHNTEGTSYSGTWKATRNTAAAFYKKSSSHKGKKI